jgi:two-component system, OmpR family, alkaline phosphatase synthesis response regulator PhoP
MVASIMVVDDDQTILALLDEILTPLGYEVHLYTYGAPDLAELRRVHPDLIICDYLVDADDVGADLLAMLRQDPDLATTPLIVCSTVHAHLRTSAGWWDQSGVSIVSKPFDIDDLLCAIQQALAAPGATPVPAGVLGSPLPASSLATTRSPRAPAHALLPHPLPAGLVVWSSGSMISGVQPDSNR